MSSLTKESKLYKKLSKKYKQATKSHNINFKLYTECIDTALKYGSKREIKYIIFRLNSLSIIPESGINLIEIITKSTRILAGNTQKHSFIISVLQNALEEMNTKNNFC